ncbi:DUF4097 family beta strand repeat-containing protein [Paenibacillus eucommiae]|uniref:DUF4097 and DUF4098 domain-containing protein YvlB n=1 Tax=Paenibacillus eucommiae TaxID=1355755 RepID=A0ABS4IYJ3_9BACL|nr:DUF4097 family beta strand repeat-containing protein [Paenibacillus eucommiae]MBP1992667.1 DUF4097 and DUF4098 domain-containing protein YvlB [Paenibacillus eucommiae]
MMKLSAKIIVLTGIICVIVGVIGVAVLMQGTSLTSGLTSIDIKKDVAAQDVNNLIIEADIGGVVFLPAENSDISVHLLGMVSKKRAEECDLTTQITSNQTLQVQACKQKNNWFNIGVNIADIRSWLFTDSEQKLRVEVYLPKKAFEQVTVKTDTGSIQLGDLQANKLNAKTDTGSVSINSFQGNNIDLQTDVGRIEIKDAQGEIRLKTNTGKIIAALQNNWSSLDARTDTGKIEIETSKGSSAGEQKATRVYLKTDTGSIHAVLPQVGNGVEAQSDVGSVTLQFLTPPNDANFYLTTDVGSVNLEIPGVDFEEKSKHRVKGSIGNGTAEVTAKSDTGSVKVGTFQ